MTTAWMLFIRWHLWKERPVRGVLGAVMVDSRPAKYKSFGKAKKYDTRAKSHVLGVSDTHDSQNRRRKVSSVINLEFSEQIDAFTIQI